jgi:hypothetical protein
MEPAERLFKLESGTSLTQFYQGHELIGQMRLAEQEKPAS